MRWNGKIKQCWPPYCGKTATRPLMVKCSQVKLQMSGFEFQSGLQHTESFVGRSFSAHCCWRDTFWIIAFMLRFVASCVETASCSDNIIHNRITVGQTGRMCNIHLSLDGTLLHTCFVDLNHFFLYQHFIQWDLKYIWKFHERCYSHEFSSL